MEVGDMREDYQYVENGGGGIAPDPSIGLCVNCKHNATCAFCGSPDSPKLFCEEFECTGASCAESEPEMAVVAGGPVAGEALTGEPDSRTRLGLCVNCDNRESCCHTIPEGGVWYCEEYR
jgi:hypothetical protein